ncbi:MAG: Nif3-like dinuclear metal center hexameric protein [Clostridia bacterium]|jgi:dinuclear metal center YbgI/SA1388 family protein|nr:Nif3-like dinuclear metal center hexameric protein [Clostridia bacterium]MCI1999488.1 Nif3-like dinuclear metal center hexameric protein [Clostridia bacterium]MCI2014133.1 Nif3-like dinuclear metal center hexameric protein [Clostridia bacterium]
MNAAKIIQILEKKVPLYLAEDWDNPGLVIGKRNREIKKVLVALDVTDDVAKEAVEKKVDMIVTHHPMIFGTIKKINDDTALGRRIMLLIENNINHYAMHTNLDTAFGGTNDALCEIIGLKNTEPLAVSTEQDGMPNGLGRIGELEKETTLGEFAEVLKKKLKLDCIRIIGSTSGKVKKIGLCTGTGMEFMNEAVAKRCDTYITADVKFHEAQKAIEEGINLIDATHYATENIIVHVIAEYLRENTDILVIESECDGQVFKHI